MKKLGLSIVGVLLLLGAYLFATASEEVTKVIKEQVQSELKVLEKRGFSITQREIKEKSEHFVLCFKDTDKITAYLNEKGTKVKKEDMLAFKGVQLGVDVNYLADVYSALSLDLYPVALPQEIQDEMREDNATFARVNSLITDKALLLHVDINKLLTGFKGYLKDINETFKSEEEKITILSKALLFSGDIKENRVQNVKQSLKQFALLSDTSMSITLTNITSSYIHTGTSKYDMKSEYNVEKIEFYDTSLLNIKLLIHNINVKASNIVSKALLKSMMNITLDNAELTLGNETQKMRKLVFDFEVNNLDISAFDTLQNIDIEDEKAINEMIQQILSKGVKMSIPDFSVEEVTYMGKTMQGFDLDAMVSIDKSLDVKAASENILAVLDKMDSTLNLSVSTELFALLAEDKKVMMFLMMMPPKDKDDKKVYNFSFSKGKLTVNGKKL